LSWPELSFVEGGLGTAGGGAVLSAAGGPVAAFEGVLAGAFAGACAYTGTLKIVTAHMSNRPAIGVMHFNA
jgi:hypothetical protein